MEVFMGTIQPFAFQFAPRDWAWCNGQILAISQYNALFALLGTYYGGNGQTNFALPNLQGRMPMSQGSGLGLTPRTIGEVAGVESVTATIANMPNHTHAMTGLTANSALQLAVPASNPATTPSATNAYLGASGGGPGSANIYSDGQGATPVPLKGLTTTVTGDISPAGGSQPMGVMNPFLVLNFSVALNGIFPSRN
ncbi:tail fiber protein [Pseudomonas sp. COR58]|uniref:Tail fiber protein n=1 Tax=Pseudomonas ekonensis TaxID=2842353 RepID=A0ABS6PL79_9PSED|nr:tail fiber protein [Pseudomonas ekonensis]MBV4460984.1 tail fiber protein [Pseudomonas ekonensis]